MEFLTIEKEDSVAIMKWHHEEQNRFNTPFMNEIILALDELEKDDKTRAIVVTAVQEKYFSTGLFLDWMMQQGAKDPELIQQFLETLNKFLMRFTAYPKPMVAAINGHAIAAGAFITSCMDFRHMRKDRGLVGLPEVQIDIPFWPGMIAILRISMPEKSLRDMAYTGDRYTSQMAYDMGFIDALYSAEELLPKSVELAAKLGQANTETFAAIKLGMRQKVLEIMKNEDPHAIKLFMKRMRAAFGKG